LDSALIRPGRIDVIAKFRKCSNQTVVQMIEFFYDMTLSREEKGRIQDLIEGIVTPAELSKIMFENFSVYEATLDHMEKLSRDTIERREQERWKLEAEEVLNRPSMDTTVEIHPSLDNIEMVVRDEDHDESDDSVVGIECIDHSVPTLECIDPLTRAEAGENVDESQVTPSIAAQEAVLDVSDTPTYVRAQKQLHLFSDGSAAAWSYTNAWSFTNANPEISLSSASPPFTPFDPLVNNASYGTYRTESAR
jgi:hypothetical protein